MTPATTERGRRSILLLSLRTGLPGTFFHLSVPHLPLYGTRLSAVPPFRGVARMKRASTSQAMNSAWGDLPPPASIYLGVCITRRTTGQGLPRLGSEPGPRLLHASVSPSVKWGPRMALTWMVARRIQNTVTPVCYLPRPGWCSHTPPASQASLVRGHLKLNPRGS